MRSLNSMELMMRDVKCDAVMYPKSEFNGVDEEGCEM